MTKEPRRGEVTNTLKRCLSSERAGNQLSDVRHRTPRFLSSLGISAFADGQGGSWISLASVSRQSISRNSGEFGSPLRI